MNLIDGLLTLDDMGLRDVFLPFLLVFAISYAVLEKAKVFQKDNSDADFAKRINLTVAIVIALLFVVGHVAGTFGEYDPVEIVNDSIAAVAVIIVAVIMVLLIMGAFGREGNFFASDTLKPWVAGFSMIIIIYIFGNAAGFWGAGLPDWLDWLNNSAYQALLLFLAVVGVVIWWIQK